MTKFIQVFLLFFLCGICSEAYAGNPDRQGEAGAYELLLNPWARSAGLSSMNTSSVYGVDAMRLNPAGLARSRSSMIGVSRMQYLTATGIGVSAGGFALPIGENGTMGLSLNAVNFGDIYLTTEDNPDVGENTPTFSPSFFNLGLAYGHVFENKVSVGALVRLVSESVDNATAFAFAIDAGVQYAAGDKNQFKLGIALRNIGSDISYEGVGLTLVIDEQDRTLKKRPLSSPLPSVLNIGASYDFLVGEKNRVTLGGNFTANSFSRDQAGPFLEYAFDEKFFIRGAYNIKIGSITDTGGEDLYTGLSVGAGLDVPVSKYSDTRFNLDYAYRLSHALGGTHNFGLGFTF